MPVLFTAILIVIAVGMTMALEAVLSRHNERQLRAQGAFEPPDDVYRWMQWAYPASFIAMGIEGALHEQLSRDALLWGFAVFLCAKALKYWAIASLGPRWSFRVLVPPAGTLVTSGPYRFVRHPNYVAVIGELVGVALMVSALVTGATAVVVFVALIRARIRVEERALGLR
jgi:methyltransferase